MEIFGFEECLSAEFVITEPPSGQWGLNWDYLLIFLLLFLLLFYFTYLNPVISLYLLVLYELSTLMNCLMLKCAVRYKLALPCLYVRILYLFLLALS